jgi:phage-related minor tail protein
MDTFKTGLTVDNLDAASTLIGSARSNVWRGNLEAVLDELLQASGEIERALRNTVREMREAEWTWQQIGDQLGVSRQAVQERFGAGPSGSRS